MIKPWWSLPKEKMGFKKMIRISSKLQKQEQQPDDQLEH
jgi:hypothetical protein